MLRRARNAAPRDFSAEYHKLLMPLSHRAGEEVVLKTAREHYMTEARDDAFRQEHPDTCNL